MEDLQGRDMSLPAYQVRGSVTVILSKTAQNPQTEAAAAAADGRKPARGVRRSRKCPLHPGRRGQVRQLALFMSREIKRQGNLSNWKMSQLSTPAPLLSAATAFTF